MADNGPPILAQTPKRADGKLDILARRSVLDDLVDNELSHCEIRYLRDRLNAIPLNYDILMNLPTELLLYIVPFLGLDVFLTARMVSRAWNERFSSPDVCNCITKLHFRSTWEISRNSAGNEYQELEKLTLGKWLPSAAQKRVRRQYGTYRSLRRRSYEGCDPQTLSFIPSSSKQTLYNNGRIAFRVDPNTICVQSLATQGSTLFLMDADREPIEEWFLSDRFLITQKSSNKLALWAWDFDLQPAGNVRLPNGILLISAYHDKVGLVTYTKEALVWHIGGALKLLDTSEVQEKVAQFDNWGVCGVLFHPTNQDSTFVVHQAWTDARLEGDSHTYTVRLIVQEFIKEKPQDISYIDTTYTIDPDFPFYEELLSGRDGRTIIPHHTVNGDGSSNRSTFNLRLKIVVNPDGLIGMWLDVRFLRRLVSHFGAVTSFSTFDMYDKKFGTGCDDPEGPKSMGHVIHGQAIDMYFKRSKSRPDKDTLGHPPGDFIYNSAEGDDDFVVLFGDTDYVVAIP